MTSSEDKVREYVQRMNAASVLRTAVPNVVRIRNARLPWKWSAARKEREHLFGLIVEAVPFAVLCLDKWNDDLQADLQLIRPDVSGKSGWYRVTTTDVSRVNAQTSRGLWALFAFGDPTPDLPDMKVLPSTEAELVQVSQKMRARLAMVAAVDDSEQLLYLGENGSR